MVARPWNSRPRYAKFRRHNETAEDAKSPLSAGPCLIQNTQPPTTRGRLPPRSSRLNMRTISSFPPNPLDFPSLQRHFPSHFSDASVDVLTGDRNRQIPSTDSWKTMALERPPRL